MPVKQVKKSEDSLFLKCDCHSHMLEVTRDDWDAETPSINVAIWASGGSGHTLTWGQRLKWAYRVLFKGELYGDEVILDIEKAKQLTNFLRRVVYKKK